jgi:hypothetical protein
MGEAPQLGPPWADLVFHVLAHVEATSALPSSLYDPVYVAFAARHAGAATNRSLADDAAAIGRVVTTHDELARLQWVAYLFDDVADARAVARCDLGELSVQDVADPRALHESTKMDAVAEALRAAAELEATYHAALPTAVQDPTLGSWLARAAVAAPRLETLRVQSLRALGLRGRVVAPAIWVGVPSLDLDVSAEHVALQAAHEATVVEVYERAVANDEPLGERDIEDAALNLLSERARKTGLAEHHENWLRRCERASMRPTPP